MSKEKAVGPSGQCWEEAKVMFVRDEVEAIERELLERTRTLCMMVMALYSAVVQLAIAGERHWVLQMSFCPGYQVLYCETCKIHSKCRGRAQGRW